MLATIAVAATLAAFWPALSGRFAYDDLTLVAENPNLRSFSNLIASWTTSFWDFARPTNDQPNAFWRPLTTLALFVANQLGGEQPFAFHVLSLAVHAAAVVMSFLVARRLTKNDVIAFGTALVFGLHPVQVESTAWIAAINDPLAGFCTLVGAYAYLGWRERGSQGIPLGAASALFVGLLAKESAAALVPICVAVDLVRASEVRGFARLRPIGRVFGAFAGATLVYYGLRCFAYGSWRAGLDDASAHLGLGVGRLMSLRVEMLGGYLRLLFAPLELRLFRDVRPVIPFGDRDLWIGVSFIVAWLAAIVVAKRSGARIALFGLLWIPAATAPLFISVEALGRCAISERFLYIAVFGAALVVADLVARIRAESIAFALFAVLALAAGWKSRERTSFWHDEETVFTRAAIESPTSPYVQWGYGRVVLEKFQNTPDEQKTAGDLNRALDAFVKSQDLGGKSESGGPRDESILVTIEDRMQANVGYGWCMLLCEIYFKRECGGGEAEKVFDVILQKDPNCVEALVGMGMTLLQKNDLDHAAELLRRATTLKPSFKTAWFDLGYAEVLRGRMLEAAQHFERAREIDPGDVVTTRELARSLADSGQEGRALDVLESARKLRPDDDSLEQTTAIVLAKLARYPEALAWIDRILQRNGSFAPARLERAKIFASMGQVDRAVADFDFACTHMPSSYDAHYWFGMLLAKRGAEKEAVPYLERALAIQPEGAQADELKAEIARCKALGDPPPDDKK